MSVLADAIRAYVAEHPDYISDAQIAEAVGCSRASVWDALNRKACTVCGGPMSHRTGDRCRPCQRADEERRVRERADRIAAMWADGQSMRQIAAVLGWSKNHVSLEMARIRDRWPGLLPYRYRTYAGVR